MYQELLSAKRGKVSDLVAIIIMFLAIIVIEVALVVLRNALPTVSMIFQTVFVAAVVFLAICFYKKRLCSYRYTYITKNSDIFGELAELPDGFSEYEEGSLFIEGLVGDSGSFIAMIHKSEIKKLCSRGEEVSSDKLIKLDARLSDRKNCCAVIFSQDNKDYVVFFEPSEKLEKAIKEAL